MSDKVKKPLLKRWWVWVVALFVVVGVANAGGEEKPATTNPPAASTTTPTSDDKAKQEAEAKAKADAEANKPENAARTAVHKAFGEKNTYDKNDSIIELKFNQDNGFLMIRVFAKDNVTEKLIKQGMWMNTHSVLKALKDNKEIKTVSFNIVMPLQDAYGKTSNDAVMKMEFGPDTRGKIAWDNFSWSGIPKIAENYWEHAVVKKINTN